VLEGRNDLKLFKIDLHKKIVSVSVERQFKERFCPTQTAFIFQLKSH
jgi:hypothetical protein